ncbi:Serine/threonine protein kinase/TGF-beta stimulated factor [Fasciolopsis buskii]|uniref:non-specific serine/threonine protein kinase n=1 Tax=Fasciolopsis buskii TaxID=27845 RepID=A0A8E0S5I5_9TREM|nr:Serine/threonine protein kinase/TGF-beta stimulated factor [Fasciolopsis buski]
MFGCWGACSEKIRVHDRTGESTTFYVRDQLDQGYVEILFIIFFSGFSTIELVSSSQSRQLYVLKRIICHSQVDEDKALREMRLHLDMPSHPNLLPCFGGARKALSRHPQGALSQVCMILQYSKQGSLQRLLDQSRFKRNPFNTRLIACLLTGICEGLSVLLSLKVPLAHRDLKPGNVLIFDNWRPVLMDFGSCTPAVIELNTYKDVEYWKEFAEENCSMTYRAPEWFQPPLGQAITERADIWSLGCLSYALCFLESPLEKVRAKGDSVALAACSANFSFPPDATTKYVWHDLTGKYFYFLFHSVSAQRFSPEMINLIKSMLNVNPAMRPSLQQVINTIEAVEPDALQNCTAEVVPVEPIAS